MLRDTPGPLGAHVGFLEEGDRVVVLEGPTEIDGSVWWYVRFINDFGEVLEGWLQGDYLATVTPVP